MINISADRGGSWAYLQSLIAELAETAPDAIAMLEGRLELDPIFLLDACATAGLLEHAELAAEVSNLRDRLYLTAKSDSGSKVLARATEDLDLGPSLDLDASGDMVEQGDRLARLTELAGLATVANAATRARLQHRLDHNAALVLAYSDSFDPLWASAAFLRDAIPAPRTHLAKAFLSEVLGALTPELYEVDLAAISTRVEALLARDTRTWWQRLKDRTTASLDTIGDFLATPVATTAYASHGVSRLRWPVPRLILSQTHDGELNLIHFGGPKLEWIGDRCVGILLDTESLMPTSGPLGVATYAELPDIGNATTLTVLLDGALTLEWAKLSPRPSAYEAPAFRWRHLAPGAARAEILAHLANEPSNARRKELEELAAALTPPPLERAVGVACFPVVGTPESGLPGALVSLRATLGGKEHPSEHEQAARAALVSLGIENAPELSLEIDSRGLALEGPSLQLAGLIAMVSRLIGREPLTPIASGLVKEGEIHPADELPSKSRIIQTEAPDTASLLPSTTKPVREVLVDAFGADVLALLLAACQTTSTALAANARTQRDTDPTRADQLAQAAIDAGATGLDLA
ncbi:MAG TPA: hypothetical protein PK095_09125, partial [Myxococcota bacterium]|nr:hypothetical protein [Myxococcota bacterium]